MKDSEKKEDYFELCKNTNLSGEVTARAVHFRYVNPLACAWTVALPCVHTSDAVEASQGVDAFIVGNDADSTPPAVHVGDQRPLARLRGVVLR